MPIKMATILMPFRCHVGIFQMLQMFSRNAQDVLQECCGDVLAAIASALSLQARRQARPRCVLSRAMAAILISRNNHADNHESYTWVLPCYMPGYANAVLNDVSYCYEYSSCYCSRVCCSSRVVLVWFAPVAFILLLVVPSHLRTCLSHHNDSTLRIKDNEVNLENSTN